MLPIKLKRNLTLFLFGSNLNGQYLGGEYARDLMGRGDCWAQWKGIDYAYKTVKMMIKPKTN